jgi:uncharacterized protein YjgD (DUF1641 family)
MVAATAGALVQRHPSAALELRDELRLLHAKLDVMGAQIQHLHEQVRAVEELKSELVPIARDAIGALGEELQAVEHEFNSEELTELGRRLVRNTPTLIRMLDRLESLDGLLTEAEPLGRQVARDLIDRMQGFEERGYFRLFRGLATLFQRVSEHATQEDIDRLADNVVPLLETLKRATQPAMRATAERALIALERSQSQPAPRLGLWGLLRTLRDPEIQEGLGLALETVRQIRRQNDGLDGGGHPPQPSPRR